MRPLVHACLRAARVTVRLALGRDTSFVTVKPQLEAHPRKDTIQHIAQSLALVGQRTCCVRSALPSGRKDS